MLVSIFSEEETGITKVNVQILVTTYQSVIILD